MSFTFSGVSLLNIIIIAMGITLCLVCFVQINHSEHLRKEVRRYFGVFFLFLLAYISFHLVRELLNGRPGDNIRSILYFVTASELIVTGFLAHMMSLMVIVASKLEKSPRALFLLLGLILIAHIVINIVGAKTDAVFYFDEANTYHRGSLYLLSNLGPVLMLLLDIYLLVRYRSKFNPFVRTAFWIYMIAPLIAVAIQSKFYGAQLVIFATVGAGAYMFYAILKEQTQQYETQRAESSRIETELNTAKHIQENMMPNIFPAYPERDEFNIYASMNPAKEVGGDFYDFFLIDENHLAMVMADVSGKGIPAALFMMIAKTLIQNTAMTGISPKNVLETVNTQICKNNRDEMFITVWLGILDLTTGNLVAANAGHEYPALKQGDGHFELVHDKHGLVVGAMEGIKYTEYELDLTPGSLLFLYTDGVPEATNGDQELFGTDRMIEALRQSENESPENILNGMNKAVNTFVADAPQFDDLTMLCIKFNQTSLPG